MDTAERRWPRRDAPLGQARERGIDPHGPSVDFWGLPDFSVRHVAGVRPDYKHDHHNDRALPHDETSCRPAREGNHPSRIS